MNTLSLNELHKEIENTINCLHKDIDNLLYPSLKKSAEENEEAAEHLKIKHYQAIDRINMYIAFHVVKTTYYDYSLKELVINKDRKTLNKILDLLKNITYEYIRNEWHEHLKTVFYKQKESRSYNEKLKNICVIARVEKPSNEFKSTGFVRIDKDKISIVSNISEASEFTALSDTDFSLNLINDFLNRKYNCKTKTFFNKNMSGRNVYIFKEGDL